MPPILLAAKSIGEIVLSTAIAKEAASNPNAALDVVESVVLAPLEAVDSLLDFLNEHL